MPSKYILYYGGFLMKTINNQKRKSVGNGEGSFYYSNTLKKHIFQYYTPSGKRKMIKQYKNETLKEFKVRVSKIKTNLCTGRYIEPKSDTSYTIIENHIKQKFNDGIIKGNTYSRDMETLKQLSKCCVDFINKPIQKVTLKDIQKSKENMKIYAPSGINRMWRLLKKAFSIASSPSINLIPYNIMNDENLKKPFSNKKTKKIFPLLPEERKRLLHILDNEERNHKYRNIVKMEWITGMRIGEVLSRSLDDINKDKSSLHIHNTLTKDENQNIIIGEHTKTYNKQTGIDEGERFFPILTDDLKQIINEQYSNKITNIYKLLFWDYDNNTFISEGEVNAWIRRINEKYHISKKNLHNHRLRHDRITQWKEAHMDMKAIQYLAGHIEGSSITDNVYIDTSPEFAFNELKKAN